MSQCKATFLSCQLLALPDLWLASRGVGEDIAECFHVFQFRSETTADDVVGVDHALHDLSLDVAMRDVSINQEPFTALWPDYVHEERENDADVLRPVLRDQLQAQALVLRPLAFGHCLDIGIQLPD